ncbi:YojF family protein [Sporosarcina trichiuri]|uniref:YojF family protein n=1 Tax=Sporosarcina trichiuri TaxID=3056445 RepID=UPI0025B5DFE6|nr:YojF family protein [Sporosarcina sp. 0.2-SM1T-5]WJY26575.1 YojF family protein [Sporosarcina sp. 0.2-SM1T-5]
MEPVKQEELQKLIDSFAGKDVYIHLETTNGAYAAHFQEGFFNAGAFIRNIVVNYELGKVAGESPHRVGLKLPSGWIYAQGITHYELDEYGRLLMAGLGPDGKLAVALQISETPFTY